MLNICVFVSTSKNGALILSFKKKKNSFENFKKFQSFVNIFVFFYKSFMSKQRTSPF